MYAVALAVLLGGCIRPLVGGPCSYEQHPGIAQVISANDNGYQLMFRLLPEPGAGAQTKTAFPLERLNGEIFEEGINHPGLAGASVGSRYYAKASVITSGTCTPVNFIIETAAP